MEEKGHIGNEKRASWRLSCRNRLSQHIWETLGVKVKPSEVRLKKEDDLDYMWQIDDPSLEPLFQKHLSKHSVGAYMQLQRGVGKTFRAVRPERETKRQIELDLIAKLQAENLNLMERLRSVEIKANHHQQTARDAEKEMRNQRSIIREAAVTIDRQKQEISNWMALSEWYQTRSLQCSDVLGQMMVFLQGVTPESTELHALQNSQEKD